MMWHPPPLFKGEPIYVIGGGPGLKGFDFGRLRGANVIATTKAGYDVKWADLLVFRDFRFFTEHQELINAWSGLVVTADWHSASKNPRIRQVMMQEGSFPPPGTGRVRAGPSSGHLGVAIALAMGGKPVILLGFDCHAVDGVTHYHDRQAREVGEDRYSDFLVGWDGWAAGAAAMGSEIVSATDTAIKEFRRVELEL